MNGTPQIKTLYLSVFRFQKKTEVSLFFWYFKAPFFNVMKECSIQKYVVKLHANSTALLFFARKGLLSTEAPFLFYFIFVYQATVL